MPKCIVKNSICYRLWCNTFHNLIEQYMRIMITCMITLDLDSVELSAKPTDRNLLPIKSSTSMSVTSLPNFQFVQLWPTLKCMAVIYDIN